MYIHMTSEKKNTKIIEEVRTIYYFIYSITVIF